MRILALDSSGLVATVAILEDEQMIAEYTVNYKKTHSTIVLAMKIICLVKRGSATFFSSVPVQKLIQ